MENLKECGKKWVRIYFEKVSKDITSSWMGNKLSAYNQFEPQELNCHVIKGKWNIKQGNN